MIETDVLIIGGGPAGSSCAWRLRQHGIKCQILDQQVFPRFKPCAGWITPDVLRDLQFDSTDYPHSFTTFRSFQISIRGFHFKLPARQYAIRRYEFDHWLVQRSGAPIQQHTVKHIEQLDGGYVVDNAFKAHYLVGAGGTHCPVARTLFDPVHPRPRPSLVVAQEEEFPYAYQDERCQLWFLENHLPGYAWYVPKANGYVNVGVGGMADALKANGDTLKNHWNLLVEKLDRLGLVKEHTYKPAGHSYYVRQKAGRARIGNAFLVGDAAGLATMDMGEGISPAIKSGLRAANAILNKSEYSLASIPRYSLSTLIRLGLW